MMALIRRCTETVGHVVGSGIGRVKWGRNRGAIGKRRKGNQGVTGRGSGRWVTGG